MLKKISGQENGQAMVEMALVLPLLLLLIFGSIEMGRICYVYLSVNNVARIGARVASVSGSEVTADDAIKNAVRNSTILTIPVGDITVSPAYNLRDSGEEVTVTVHYSVHLIAPLINVLIDDDHDGYYEVDAACKMRLE